MEEKDYLDLLAKKRDTTNRHTYLGVASHAESRTFRLSARFGKDTGYGG